MLKIIFFLAIILGLGYGFAWLADRPGNMVLIIAQTQFEFTLITAAAGLLAIISAVLITWWLFSAIINSPKALGRFFRTRKRDRGYQALSSGLIAAGAGNADLARRLTKKTDSLLDVEQEPLVRLLDAQTAILEGKHDEARQQFTDMLEGDETRLLGLRGLYLEAQRLGETEAVNQYAEKAALEAPQLSWATNATLKSRSGEGDWDRAIAMVEVRRVQKQIDKETASRERAVLLTAKAMTLLPTEPKEARNLALEAVRDAPDLIPAAITGAEAAFALEEYRKGSKVLEAAWKQDAHPQVGQAYLYAKPGDSASDRLKRAKHLASFKPEHPDSRLLLAQAHLEAGEFMKARQGIEAVVRERPTERAWLILADIEEAETNDQGRVRQWLSNAVKAPRDPQWTADAYTSDHWAPISPVTGELDAFEWKVPTERMATLIDHENGYSNQAPVDPAMLAMITAAPEIKDVPVTTVEVTEKPEPAEIIEAEVVSVETEAKIAEDVTPPSADAVSMPKTDDEAPKKRFSLF